jgi:thiol-disulfide isomerase/thioredoxin
LVWSVAGAATLFSTLAVTIGYCWDEKPSPQPDAAAKATIEVPAGTPEEQLDFLMELKEKRPAAQDREAMLAHYQNVFEVVATTTSKLLKQPLEEPTKVKAQTARLEALTILGRLGDKQAGDEAQEMAAGLTKHADKELASMARTLVLQGTLNQVLEGKTEQAPKLIEGLKSLLEGKLTQQHLQSARAISQVLEQVGEYDAARQAHAVMRERFLKSGDVNLMGAVEDFSRSAEKRLASIGKPMELAGTQLDGKPLDWSKYNGKVVLVDFWATWCGPCVAEIPNVKENYEKYHARGFEVVGVSLDEDRSALEQFVKTNELPWTTLFSDDPKQNQKLADKYGVTGIPALFLVGPDGNVLTLKARGEDLGQQLEKLLGAGAKKKG